MNMQNMASTGFDNGAVRYRRNIDIQVQNFDIVLYRYRRFVDIEDLSISTNVPSLSV
jgi:hypothetical protein